MSSIRHLEEVTDEGAAVLGGKGWNLALTARAGLPVPPAFCITSDAHRQAKPTGVDSTGIGNVNLRRELLAAYERLGRGVVAVRSSATVEDGAAASFAGLARNHSRRRRAMSNWSMPSTLLAIDRLRACAVRTGAHRQRRRKPGGDGRRRAAAGSTAEVSGVLFTRDPLDATGQRMLVEAAWGLGESVVSGRVTPDRFHIDRDTGAVHDQQITSQGHASHGGRPLGRGRTIEQIGRLLERRTAWPSWPNSAGRSESSMASRATWNGPGPTDACGCLQARPITTAGAAEREQVRREEIAKLAELAEPARHRLGRYNLAEVLPTPTPMTWAIVSRLMSGQGRLGLMFRDLGFDPGPDHRRAGLHRPGLRPAVCQPQPRGQAALRRISLRSQLRGAETAPRAGPLSATGPRPVAGHAWVLLATAASTCSRCSAPAAAVEQASPHVGRSLARRDLSAFAASATAALPKTVSGLSRRALLARLDDWRRARWTTSPANASSRPRWPPPRSAKLEQRLDRQLGAEAAAESQIAADRHSSPTRSRPGRGASVGWHVAS